MLLAIVREQSRARLVDIPRDFLRTDEERKLYTFLRKHVSTHDKFPSLKTIRRRFSSIDVSVPPEPSGYYREEVAKRAVYNLLREPYAALGEAFQGAHTDMERVMSIIDEMASIRRRFNVSGGVDDSRTLLSQVLQEFEEARLFHGLRGVTTGFEPIDDLTGGYMPDDLVFWIGRPGRGKSWLLIKQAFEAWRASHRVLWMSLEMGGLQSMRRMVGLHSGINPNLIRRGMIQTSSQDLLRRGIAEMNEIQPMHMVTANFDRTVPQLAAYIEQYDPDIIYVDATYLLTPEKKRRGSEGRRESIADVINELKQLGADCRRPIIGTVQFNRDAERTRRAIQQSRASGEGQPQVFDPIAHLSLDKIGETDVIGQTASHVLGLDVGLAPYERSTRAFGFLKGREGEDGRWYCNYPDSQIAPIDLSIIPRDDPRIEIMERPQARNGGETAAAARNPNMLNFMRS